MYNLSYTFYFYIASFIDPKNTIYHKFKQSNLYALLPSIILGCFIWFGITPTDELTVTSIRLLAVFMRYFSFIYIFNRN